MPGEMTVIPAAPVAPETSSPAAAASMDQVLVAGLAWTALFRWAAQLVGWFATFYAARLLLPADYGIVSMAGIGVGLVRMIEGFGLDTILVQDRWLIGERQARVSGFIFATSFALLGLFWLAAPFIAQFFREPRVAAVIRGMSLLLIFDALQVVPRATLQRALQFRRLAIVTFVQLVTTSIVLVAAVTIGMGHWSLVLNSIGGAMAATVMLLVWAPFKVSWPRDLASIARPLLQGWRVLASRIAWYGYASADQTIIGRFLGKDLLGAYSFSYSLSMIAQDEISSIVGRVAPGIFSAVQEQRAELRRYYLLLTEFLTVLSFPVAIGMCVTADLAVPLVLGPEWGNAIVPLQLLCIYSAFLSAQSMNSHVLMWTGQFRVHMWLSILALVGWPPVLLVAVRYGLPGVAFAWAFIFPILNLPAFFYAFRTIRATIWDWLDSVKAASIACLVMSVAVVATRALLPDSLPLAATMVVAVIAGAVAYLTTLWFAFNSQMRALIQMGRILRG